MKKNKMIPDNTFVFIPNRDFPILHKKGDKKCSVCRTNYPIKCKENTCNGLLHSEEFIVTKGYYDTNSFIFYKCDKCKKTYTK
jgi:hypothetical protein